jgi:uncharacterized membrane protein
MQLDGERKPRIGLVDVARGAALAAMAVYHFTWDLEFFGYIEPGTTAFGGWKLFARAIASSFLFLVGVSLVLAHGSGIRWQPYLKRLAMIAAAAVAISLVTWFAVPGGFIFFGILHQIALASLIGLAFLRVPWPLTLAAAALAIAAPHYLRDPTFDAPLLWWVGLSSIDPPSNDYVPLFPWIGAVLGGIAATRVAGKLGLLTALGTVRPGRWSAPFTFAGRHSLAFYLIHQPVLIAAIFLFAQLVPPVERSAVDSFTSACNATCEETRDGEFCRDYCACVLDRLEDENRLDDVFAGDQDAETTARLNEIASICTIETDMTMPPPAED